MRVMGVVYRIERNLLESWAQPDSVISKILSAKEVVISEFSMSFPILLYYMKSGGDISAEEYSELSTKGQEVLLLSIAYYF